MIQDKTIFVVEQKIEFREYDGAIIRSHAHTHTFLSFIMPHQLKRLSKIEKKSVTTRTHNLGHASRHARRVRTLAK